MEKDYTFTGYNRKLMEAARQLRQAMTPQEKRLWENYLRKYPVHFYRQRVIERYILDFYSSKAKLGIEIDGSQHYTATGKEYDANRTEILSERGIFVLRFSNTEIDRYFESVCKQIDAETQRRLKFFRMNS